MPEVMCGAERGITVNVKTHLDKGKHEMVGQGWRKPCPYPGKCPLTLLHTGLPPPQSLAGGILEVNQYALLPTAGLLILQVADPEAGVGVPR